MGSDRGHDRQSQPAPGTGFVNLPDADWLRREGMASLISLLGGDGGNTRYVGGCVRDTLLGLDVSDVDLATRLPPDTVMERLKKAGVKAVPTGLDHGTVTAVLPHGPVEITTLRRDVSTDGRRATIVYTEEWNEDAARRDFTINALSADTSSGRIWDYFGGLEDLAARRVRFIGDPLIRIAEDHLRILRFFRFHARFGAGAADPAALEACSARANDLMALSRERIADELLKLLAFPNPAPVVGLMLAHDILKPVLPEIAVGSESRLATLAGREQASKVAPDPVRRLAALLPADSDIATAVAARLRLSKKSSRRLISAASRADSDEADAQRLAYRIGATEAVDRILLGEGEASASLMVLRDWQPPRLKVSGGDLIAMGLTPGPPVARTLHELEREWAERDFPEDEPLQRALARALVDQALREAQ